MRNLHVGELPDVNGGVNWTLVGQGAITAFAGSVAVGVGAVSGPLGVPLVIVGGSAAVMGATAMAAGVGDASDTGGGGGCVAVDSVLPDGRRAGEIRVGDTMQLGNEHTGSLITEAGIVSYSENKTMKGFRIVTRNGISLRCSDTAPIWTETDGYQTPANLMGKKIGVRVDDTQIRTSFETVETVEEIGEISVQHITVGNRAFWAGENNGAYILHHNMKAIDFGSGSSWDDDWD